MAIGSVALCFLTACQKEPYASHLELTAEGMGGSRTKMTVDGLSSYWQTGDSVNINGDVTYIAVTGSRAYIEGEFYSEKYYMVFPGGLYRGRTGDVVTVDMPAVYRYRKNTSSGQQILNAPMAYCGTAANGKAMMRHLTGALNVDISGPSGIRVDRITVSTTQNRVMNGEMQFDLSDMESIGSSSTNATANNSVVMLFDGGIADTRFGTGVVQIPVPVLNGDVNFTVKVEAHLYESGLKHTFVRTQTTGGHLGRAVAATVAVCLDEGAEGVATSALFEDTVVGGKTYYKLQDELDLRLFSAACRGYSYREDGDDYYVDWSYNNLKYVEANYIVTSDIDMESVSINAFEGFKGEFNGDGHTISNLDVVCGGNYEWGLFLNGTDFGGTVKVVENVTFDGLKVTGCTASEYSVGGGALSGGGHIKLVSDVHVSNFTVGRTSNYCLCLGGFFGSGGDTVRNSSVSFTPNQTVVGSNYYVRYLPPTCLGGITGECGNPPVVENTTVNFNNLTFKSTYSTMKCVFGGVFVSSNSYGVETDNRFSGVTVQGHVNIQGSTVYGGKVYTMGNSSFTTVDEVDGVDVSGLTITVN